MMFIIFSDVSHSSQNVSENGGARPWCIAILQRCPFRVLQGAAG
jgi:hypothetical protein